MRRFCDLHTHSTASDGTLSPRELVELADRRRLAGLALTDHDTVDGLAEGAEAAGLAGLTFVGGIEVSAVFGQGTLHILGLCVDPANRSLAELAVRLRAARAERNPRMVAKLQAMGVDITMAEVLAAAGADANQPDRVVGRAHMATVLSRKGYVRDLNEAFERYIGAGAPAFVDKERLPPAEAVAGIHAAGGLAILAHPVQLEFDNFAQCETMVRSLVHDGLDGLEAYHSDHSDLQTRFFLDLADKLGLAVSGGSDFHGSVKQRVQLGNPRVPALIMERLLKRANEISSRIGPNNSSTRRH